MFKNYLLIALRNMKRYKAFSFINMIGLAIGIACCVLLVLWIQDELSYNRFHRNAHELYRVTAEKNVSGRVFISACTPNPLGPALEEEYPEILHFTRYVGGWPNWIVRCGDKIFENDRLAAADPTFFEMFKFPFLKGNPQNALNDRYSIVITEAMAKKYFGDDDPMGKVIKVAEMDLKVTGLLRNFPSNSSIQFDYIFPIENMRIWWDEDLDNWKRDIRFNTYVQLPPDVSPLQFSQKIAGVVKKYDPQTTVARLFLQPFLDIHLHSRAVDDQDNLGKGSIIYVYVFILIAFCILLLACINFMNLSTARVGIRAKEVGLRKVVGASRTDLVKQFLGESILFSFIALILAIILVYLFLPVLNQLSGKQLTLNLLDNSQLIFIMAGITLLTGILAGSYPAIFLSSLQPVSIIKEITSTGKQRKAFLRKFLVVFQFAITIMLVFLTLGINTQLRFIRNKDLGFTKDNIIYFLAYGQFVTNREAVKSELEKNPDILGITISSPPIGIPGMTSEVNWEGKDPGKTVMMSNLFVDYNYLDVFEIKMVEGRFFSKQFTTDPSNFIVNEVAAGIIGQGKSPLGKQFRFRWTPTSPTREGVIIGVIKNYHQGSLHNPIPPMVLMLNSPIPQYCIKLNPAAIPAAIAFISDKWKKFVGSSFPFSYKFVDETIDNHYRVEQRIHAVFEYFTLLAIFISCLGLFGLSFLIIEQKTKEIGIRKVLGASIPTIVLLLSKSFVRWVVLANIIALPMAWYIMENLLKNYTYRTSIGVWIFVLTGGLTLAIAFGTVAYQTIKAATANPVDSLKYE